MAQIFFGAGAIKQKKRNAPVVNPLVGNPPAMNSPVGDAPADSYVLVINGIKYELSGFVLGTIVYYNCAVTYVIIAVSISFFNRKIPCMVT